MGLLIRGIVGSRVVISAAGFGRVATAVVFFIVDDEEPIIPRRN
jgi:hypothetical protein